MFGNVFIEFLSQELLQKNGIPLVRLTEKLYVEREQKAERDEWIGESYYGFFRYTKRDPFPTFLLKIAHNPRHYSMDEGCFEIQVEVQYKENWKILVERDYFTKREWTLSEKYEDLADPVRNNLQWCLFHALEDALLLDGGNPFLEDVKRS